MRKDDLCEGSLAVRDETVASTQLEVEPKARTRPEAEPEDLRSADAGSEEISPDGASRRRLAGQSAKLLIYAPPLIQLFLPSKAMAGNYSS